ncbi:phage tail tape measure protein [Paenibacillus glucanolyticus]|uniref:phage tail tape measure protein n=1 Tax=Paenibacillus glucanolyticus TaxID=59843 RepID=UPI0020B13813|nr:phage tail tape measure protein [Paenibacillus glucanolyticus]
MDNIMRFVEAARRRLQRFRVVAYALYGLIAGFAALLLLLVIGRFVPIAWLPVASVVIPIAAGLGGLLWGWLHRVPIEEAASVMDQVPDGAERSDMMVTALSFKEEESQAAKWQREQAERYGARFAEQLPERLPSPSRKRQLWICSASLAAVIVLVFVPNPMDKKVEAAKEQQSWMKEQVAKTEKLAEQLQKETLDPADRKKLQEKLDALKKALDHEKQPEQALDKLEEAMKELEKLAKQQEEKAKALSELAKKMQQEKALSQVGKRLAEGMAEELKQEMKKLTEQVKKMSQEEKNELSDALKKLAEEASKQMENGDLEKELKKAADALKDGKLPKELEEALQQLAEELAKAAQAKAASDSQSQSAASLAASLASQGLSLADQMAAAGMSVSDAWSNGGSAEALAQAGLGEGSGEQGEASEGSSGEGGPVRVKALAAGKEADLVLVLDLVLVQVAAEEQELAAERGLALAAASL